MLGHNEDVLVLQDGAGGERVRNFDGLGRVSLYYNRQQDRDRQRKNQNIAQRAFAAPAVSKPVVSLDKEPPF